MSRSAFSSSRRIASERDGCGSNTVIFAWPSPSSHCCSFPSIRHLLKARLCPLYNTILVSLEPCKHGRNVSAAEHRMQSREIWTLGELGICITAEWVFRPGAKDRSAQLGVRGVERKALGEQGRGDLHVVGHSIIYVCLSSSASRRVVHIG
jgi:hypothetical protein